MSRIPGAISFVFLCTLLAAAQDDPLQQIWKQATRQQVGAALSNDKVIAGLKEALKVSTTKAVSETGRPNGFLANEAIKIVLPKKLKTAETGLRLFGQGDKLDQLEVGMNRAAERATPLAKKIFLDALMSMTIQDAKNILRGNDTAATEYFRRTSSDELSEAFRPIVRDSMEKVGVLKQYNDLMRNPVTARALQAEHFDLDNYVLGKTLDGLFYMMGQEEKRIRTNPAARTTQLLKQVFGSLRR